MIQIWQFLNLLELAEIGLFFVHLSWEVRNASENSHCETVYLRYFMIFILDL